MSTHGPFECWPLWTKIEKPVANGMRCPSDDSNKQLVPKRRFDEYWLMIGKCGSNREFLSRHDGAAIVLSASAHPCDKNEKCGWREPSIAVTSNFNQIPSNSQTCSLSAGNCRVISQWLVDKMFSKQQTLVGTTPNLRLWHQRGHFSFSVACSCLARLSSRRQWRHHKRPRKPVWVRFMISLASGPPYASLSRYGRGYVSVELMSSRTLRNQRGGQECLWDHRWE